MSKEFEAANLIPPLKNTNGMKALFCVLADHTSRTQDLSAYFDGLDEGHFITIIADGAKCYVALGATAGTISEIATGNGNTICYPIPDGAEKAMIPVAGRETVATAGIATLSFYKVLHYITAATGVTSYLRGYRSSFGEGQNAGIFKPGA